jgi:hypothetical protein
MPEVGPSYVEVWGRLPLRATEFALDIVEWRPNGLLEDVPLGWM